MRASTVASATEHLIRYGGEFIDLIVERADGSWLTTRTAGASWTSPRARCAPRSGTTIRRSWTRSQEASAARSLHLFSGLLSRDVTELAREHGRPARPARARDVPLTGGEANEAALRLAKLHTGGYEVLAFAGSWHGLTAGAGSNTYAGAARLRAGDARDVRDARPNSYRCPIRHCRDRCDIACLDAGFDAVGRAVGRRAGRGDRRADLERRRHHRSADGYFVRLRERATRAACC